MLRTVAEVTSSHTGLISRTAPFPSWTVYAPSVRPDTPIILGKYSTLMDICNKYEFKVPDIGHEAKPFYLQKNKSRRAFIWAC